jgi:hydrogenase maturation protease
MTTETVVIGIGHPYRRDDGVGPAVLDLLAAAPPAGMTLIVSTGEATELIAAWEHAGCAVLVDALHHPHAVAGRVRTFTVDGAAAEYPSTASTHGIGIGHTVALARALHRLPARLIVYAIEVTDTGYGVGLSDPVAVAAATVAERIRRGC